MIQRASGGQKAEEIKLVEVEDWEIEKKLDKRKVRK